MRRYRFQVPKGMLQTKLEICKLENLKFVSSPQGNATNKGRKRMDVIADLLFQVPKGMLQTIATELQDREERRFQVPKGMLQTLLFLQSRHQTFFVSSPQGNATNCSFAHFTILSAYPFQVPKGMLQTEWRKNVTETAIKFQVPKGMLQTLLRT